MLLLPLAVSKERHIARSLTEPLLELEVGKALG
jgi:hypothetical protein